MYEVAQGLLVLVDAHVEELCAKPTYAGTLEDLDERAALIYLAVLEVVCRYGNAHDWTEDQVTELEKLVRDLYYMQK